MAAWKGVREIVHTQPGPGTCETIYTDNHGDRWRSDPYPISFDTTTGQKVGHIIGTRIYVKTI